MRTCPTPWLSAREESLMPASVRNTTVVKGIGAGALALGLVGAGVHLSSGASGSDGVRLTAAETAVSVTCPDVAGRIGAVPDRAQAQVATELANLERQIAAVNARLAREPGQAQSQLGDLAGKRGAVIDRIVLDFTRLGATAPAGLRGLVDCSLGGAAAAAPAAPGGAGGAGAGGSGAGGAGAAGGRARTVNCPAVAGALPAVPASAQAEVTRNLALLDTQIGEADARLARLAVKPEGGPAFVQNAILGPLKDKRVATLNRIATAIGRTAARPGNLVGLAGCSLN
jgi:hypothetical protein